MCRKALRQKELTGDSHYNTRAAIGARADRVIARLRQVGGNALVFSSGHFTRVLAVRWLGLDVSAGRLFVLGTASVCVLGYDHDRDEPAIHLWNDTLHVGK